MKLLIKKLPMTNGRGGGNREGGGDVEMGRACRRSPWLGVKLN